MVEKNSQAPTDGIKIGDFIGGYYEVYRILKGGMGVVYVCYDYRSHFPTVLKTFKKEYIQTDKDEALFKKEALIWIKIGRHPYIIHADSVAKIDRKLFIMLEYISPDSHGRNTLAHYFGYLAFPETLKLSIQFCYGIEYAYSRGIDAHRDIKPDNIMITPEKTVKITDFGLAKAFQEIQFKENNISKKEEPNLCVFKSKGRNICGTPPYMSPEQFDGYADKRSDIYSFGIVLYQLGAEGALPFIGESAEEYEWLHKRKEALCLPSPLSSIIKRCLEKNPDKRYRDFAVIREELQKTLLEETGEKIIQPETSELELWDLIGKGSALDVLGKYDEALVCYGRILKEEQNNAMAWHNKGIVLRNLGKREEALACFSKALEINPKDADFWYTKGTFLNDIGRYDEAVLCFDRALEINSRHTYCWNNKGSALFSLGRLSEAIICFDKSLEINKRNIVAWYNKGSILVESSRLAEAITCFDKALEINSEYAEVWYNKGTVLNNLGMSNEAITCFDRALEITLRDAETWNNKGIALNNLGRTKEAIKCYDKAVEINPEFAEAWFHKGLALGKLNTNNEALKCVEEAIRLDPNFTEAVIAQQLLQLKLRE